MVYGPVTGEGGAGGRQSRSVRRDGGRAGRGGEMVREEDEVGHRGGRTGESIVGEGWRWRTMNPTNEEGG